MDCLFSIVRQTCFDFQQILFLFPNILKRTLCLWQFLQLEIRFVSLSITKTLFLQHFSRNGSIQNFCGYPSEFERVEMVQNWSCNQSKSFEPRNIVIWQQTKRKYEIDEIVWVCLVLVFASLDAFFLGPRKNVAQNVCWPQINCETS